MKGKTTMTLKELLNTTNTYDQIRIHIENKTNDDLVLIFKGTAQDACHYFNGVDKAMNSKVAFISLTTDHQTKAPLMFIVIR